MVYTGLQLSFPQLFSTVESDHFRFVGTALPQPGIFHSTLCLNHTVEEQDPFRETMSGELRQSPEVVKIIVESSDRLRGGIVCLPRTGMPAIVHVPSNHERVSQSISRHDDDRDDASCCPHLGQAVVRVRRGQGLTPKRALSGRCRLVSHLLRGHSSAVCERLLLNPICPTLFTLFRKGCAGGKTCFFCPRTRSLLCVIFCVAFSVPSYRYKFHLRDVHLQSAVHR